MATMPKATIEIDVPLVVRRLDALYEAAVELMLPRATTDELGDLKRLRRHIDSGVGPANGHPFHWQFLEALIDEATLRIQQVKANNSICLTGDGEDGGIGL